MHSMISQYYHTLKYLRWTQIKYRLLYAFNQPRLNVKKIEKHSTPNLKFSTSILSQDICLGADVFKFLNIQHAFQNGIDWNYNSYGKLWTYNLNYFEFLLQSKISKEEGLRLIYDFINQSSTIKDGMEPFPISLRCICWIKFLLQHRIDDSKVNSSLFQQ